MNATVWVRELAAEFWQRAGTVPPAPRDLHGPMTLAFPVTAVALADLCVTGTERWLRRNGVPCDILGEDRALRACLVARSEHAAVFLDCDDPENERRFSLAHELAHFLHDYWKPRLDAAQMYGSEVLGVFDGTRPPRPEERIQALLARVPIGFHVHLMARENGAVVDGAIARAERDADRLAFELLAPEDDVFAGVAIVPEADRREAALELLLDTYGLPFGPADRYSTLLFPDRPTSFVRRLWAVP